MIGFWEIQIYINKPIIYYYMCFQMYHCLLALRMSFMMLYTSDFQTWLLSCFFKSRSWPIFLQNYDFNKAFRQSQSEKWVQTWYNDSSSVTFHVSRWAPFKYNAIMVAPETNPVSLAIEQISFSYHQCLLQGMAN